MRFWPWKSRLPDDPVFKIPDLKIKAVQTGPPYHQSGDHQVNCALICTIRGEASPPRNDPTMLVGVLTVLMMVPKLELARSLTG